MLYRNLKHNSQKIDINNLNNFFWKRNIKKKSNSFKLENQSYESNKFRPNTPKNSFLQSNRSRSNSNSFFNSLSFIKKPNSSITKRSAFTPGPSKIYMRLNQRKKIEKIIQEESRKYYTNRKMNYSHNISAEELKRRIFSSTPQNAYKRQLKRNIRDKFKIKTKTYYQSAKNRIKDDKKYDFNDNINNLIKANKNLIRNFGTFSSGSEMRYSLRNYNIVNNYFQKAEKQKEKISLAMNKQFYSNKYDIFKDLYLEKEFSKFNKGMSNKNYNKFKHKYNIRVKNKLKEKSKVINNIIIDELNSNLDKIKSIKSETLSRNKINYVALTNKIFQSNLINQMNIVYIKDPSMNILRSIQNNNFPIVRSEISLYDEFKRMFNKYNDNITFSRYNKIKLSLPKFIKTKFRVQTNKKYGHIIDSYFGIPV